MALSIANTVEESSNGKNLESGCTVLSLYQVIWHIIWLKGSKKQTNYIIPRCVYQHFHYLL